ncbi:hypothetical protein BC938DRAFT_471824 [Jimgerdemannia flammicorona]|uniref:Cytochrome b5 heme-binding domain-containing protein n=1 Tax=Jimgerdemannia flammicorona TaxID=994334 RepID=A0A433Q7C8_9FUNG|nr:hypothetical protein BC938DRAFT_471824 [Jimgerdemannia flammicorona]
MSNLSQRKKPATSPSGPDSETDISLKSNESGSLVFTVLKVFVWIVVMFFFCSYLVTETWTWGYEGKYTNLKRYIPKNELVLSEEQLKVYDGSDPNLPIYIAIDGEVFDVTEGRGYYGPVRASYWNVVLGGSYHQFAGRDAARAWVTGCFETHLTHDLRGLTEEQMKVLLPKPRFPLFS